MKNINKFWLMIVLFCSFFASCKKENVSNNVSIQGQLLESSSNPIIIRNYTLSFYQEDNSGLFGGVQGFEKTIQTDNNGNFYFQYDPGKNFGLSSGGINENSISIYGFGYQNQINPTQPVWLPVEGGKNTNLNKLYLYKKIGKLIRKVTFFNALNTGESLKLISSNGSGSDYKTFFGPILSGTSLTDTITDCKLNFFNIKTQSYNLSLTLQKPQYQKDTSYIVNSFDEITRIAEIVY